MVYERPKAAEEISQFIVKLFPENRKIVIIEEK